MAADERDQPGESFKDQSDKSRSRRSRNEMMANCGNKFAISLTRKPYCRLQPKTGKHKREAAAAARD